MSDKERQTLQKTARSRTAAVRQVERAGMILASSEGKSVAAIALELGLREAKVRKWVKRFNAGGIPALADAGREGRPGRYTAAEVSEMVATALTEPTQLGLPFGSWTLDRLTAYLNEVKGIGIQRSRLDEVLLREGLRWRSQETWFGKRVDPEFAQKRGRL
jgi:transposase